ncbi:MAG: glycosyltransferase [Muribaculaceae bacterium]|nr:glycosyltransferase [Muribaculaceae bacterium]
MTPRISVIMGIYNCGSTLAEALDSLLAQTCQDFKVIMCDDGSSDNTLHIALQYVSRDPDKFILIQNERNMGLNYTLNHCLKYADTEYVARMDGDDISLPTRFEQELNFLDCHPEIAIVSTPMIYFDENGDFRRGGGGDRYPDKNDFVTGTPFCHAPCMVRREAYEAVGGYSVDPKLLRVEDYHLWFKMYAKGYRGYILAEPLYRMRDDRNAIGRRTWRNRINEFHVRRIGYSMLSLPLHKRIWMLRPIIVGLLPRPIYNYLHRRNS